MLSARFAVPSRFLPEPSDLQREGETAPPAASELAKTTPSADELLRRECALSTLVALVHEFVTGGDLDEVLPRAVARLALLTGVERASLVLLGGGESATVFTSSDAPQLHRLPIRIADYPELRRCVERAASMMIEDIEQDPELAPWFLARSVPFRCLGLIPLRDDTRTLGVLFLRAERPASLDPELFSLLSIWCRAAASALQNAASARALQAERRHQAAAHEQAERRLHVFQPYSEFFEDSADGMVVMEPTGRILFANPRARSLAADFGPIEGANVAAFLPPEELERGRELARGFSHGTYPKGVDFKVRSGDGIRVVSVNFSATLRDEGAVLLTFRDVTLERRTEQELVQTKNFLERVIDSSVDAIVSADLRGRVLIFNRAAARIFGYEPDDVLGKRNVADLYPPGVARTVMRYIRSDDFGGKDRLEGYQVNMLDSAGHLVPVKISAALIYEAGRAVGSVGIFTDIREQLRMQARLWQAQDEIREHEKNMAVAQLAGATAHELNQPLTNVMGYTEMLLRKLEQNSPLAEAATVILSQAERMANIVRRIGRITRYETKSYVGSAQILDLERAAEADAEAFPPEDSGARPRR